MQLSCLTLRYGQKIEGMNYRFEKTTFHRMPCSSLTLSEMTPYTVKISVEFTVG